jgi:hypothetical protein
VEKQVLEEPRCPPQSKAHKKKKKRNALKGERAWERKEGQSFEWIGDGKGYVTTPMTAMRILSWNCRGLGSFRTVRDLCRAVKEKSLNGFPHGDQTSKGENGFN